MVKSDLSKRKNSIAGMSWGMAHVHRTLSTAPFTQTCPASVCPCEGQLAILCVHAVSLMDKIQQLMLEVHTGRCLRIFLIFTLCFIMLETLTELCSKLLPCGRGLRSADLTAIRNTEEEGAWTLPRQGCLYNFEVGK